MACHCALKGDLAQKVDHTSFGIQFRGGGGKGPSYCACEQCRLPRSACFRLCILESALSSNNFAIPDSTFRSD